MTPFIITVVNIQMPLGAATTCGHGGALRVQLETLNSFYSHRSAADSRNYLSNNDCATCFVAIATKSVTAPLEPTTVPVVYGGCFLRYTFI
ncbi:hypothetical protein D0Y65_030740 [Glycine soja]|uniref:Gnk2-homologous domain-containing protein n=1 Tax=Glycine soja TaxID=3848 RepID=A0A445I550_GLYSO|nr:hypothetical protein D0Y65_030740 [Glycine soja]